MIRKYLSNKAIVQNIATIEELEQLIESGEPLKVMMGQSFDGGQPVDMMKYALFMMNFSDLLNLEGIDVKSNWLIADHFVVDINQDQTRDEAKKQVEQRINYLRRLNEVYAGDIGFVMSSELSRSEGYKKNLETLFKEAGSNVDFKELVMKSIPPDRRDNPNALRYPFEELATIQTMDTNVKIGPVREKLYDEPAREFAPVVGFNKYVAIQLTRSFPFGMPEIPAETSEEIEELGILPYKKGSKGLGDYRIDPMSDSLEKAQELIRSTKDPRSIFDILVIADQAQQRLNGHVGSSHIVKYVGTRLYDASKTGKLLDLELRDIAADYYKNFIYEQLRK